MRSKILFTMKLLIQITFDYSPNFLNFCLIKHIIILYFNKNLLNNLLLEVISKWL